MKAPRLFLLLTVLWDALLQSEVSGCQPPPLPALPQCDCSADCAKDKCCVQGFCQPRKGKCNPCDEITCKDYETCELVNDTNCKKKPCRKVARCVSKQIDTLGKDLCAKHKCPKGEKCYIIGGRCRPGLVCIMIIETPICASPDPCSTMVCNEGFTCVNVQNGRNPPYGSCQIVNDPCKYLACPEPDERCYVKNSKCRDDSTAITPVCGPADPCKGVVCRVDYICIIVEDNYYKSFAQCVPRDDVCAYTICKADESCVVLKRYPPIPVCTNVDGVVPHPPPGNPCDGLVCLDNQKCYYEKICMKTSCYLKPSCVPLNPCEKISCGKDYFCHVSEANGLPVGRCTPYEDPCAFTLCPPGSVCIILTTYPPQPRCTDPNPKNPCLIKKCPPYTKCQAQYVNGTLEAQCVYIRSPCDGLVCPANDYCFQSSDNCGSVPTAQCTSFKRCEGITCPKENQYCQEFSNELSPPEAFCVPLTRNPCDNISCPEGQKCFLSDVDCLSCPVYGYCTDTDPCRTNPCSYGYQCVVIDYGIFAPQYECVVTSDPCEGIGCPEFQRCYTENPNCLVDSTQKEPVCGYSNPCNHILCPNGTICSWIQEDNFPPKAQCVLISDPCYGFECPEFQKCYLRDVVCVRAPCYPVPTCAYHDPCVVTDCEQSYKCVVRQNGKNPPTAECVVDYDAICSGVECLKFQQCYLEDVVCVRAPCPPISSCSYYNPCMYMRCAAGYKCMVTDNGYYRPTANCVPDRQVICEDTVCLSDQQCYLHNVTCVTEPCTPVAECAYTNPCVMTDCSPGYICVVQDNGDYVPAPQCVLDYKSICLYHVCPLYQKCYLMDVNCKKPPCYPEPVCAYPDPCLFDRCGKGYTCAVIEEKPKPPTAYCLLNYDVCFGVSCKPDYSCYIKDVECYDDLTCYPVPETAVCSLPNPCVDTKCPVGSSCEITQLPRNNPPVAKCVQSPTPCDNIVCEPYEQCYIKDYDCNETGCFDITPVGVCGMSNPCIVTLCTTGSVCLPVQIRRNPPRAVCDSIYIYTPCNNVYCDFGLQCYVKDVDCSEFGCTAISPVAECAIPDPCQSMECTDGTVCIIEQSRNNPPVGKCKPLELLCDNVICYNEGEKCYIFDFVCNETGCFRLDEPYAGCVISDPCQAVFCIADSTCYSSAIRNNPPQAICVKIPPPDICEGVTCSSSSYGCFVKDYYCDEFSCTVLEPVAVCSLINPCMVVRCPGGPCVSVQVRDNPPEAMCLSNDPCRDFTCTTPGEQCYVKDYECNSTVCYYIQPEAVCANPDPCAATLCQEGTFCLTERIRNNPPIALCGPTIRNPCDLVDCQPSDWCYIKDFECVDYSCRLIELTAVCAPSDPCYNVTCLANSACVPSQIRLNPPQAYCDNYSQMCNNVRCSEGEKCYIVQVQCIKAPCPPLPMCLPADPCASTKCLPGYKCINKQFGFGPPEAVCEPLDDLCDGVNCTDGQQCYLREKFCRCPPCGYEAVCAYPNPCVLALCPEGYGCYPKRVGRLEPVPVCYPIGNPCSEYDCLPGQECTSDTKIACVQDLPCPRPICLGDPTPNLCYLARCGPGFECVVDLAVEPLVATCIPYKDPCSYTICPNGSFCVVQESYPPIGRCQHVPDTNPCAFVRCQAGYNCEETGTNPVQAQCIPTCAVCPLNTDCIVIETYPPIIRCKPNPKWLIPYSQS